MLKFHLITQQFLLVGVEGLIVCPGAGYPRYAIDTHTVTLLVFERWAIIELNKSSLTSSQSKIDERIAKSAFFPKTTSELAGFFLTLCAEHQRENL